MLICFSSFVLSWFLVSETVLSYSKLVSELEQMVKKMVFESYDAEKYYDSHIQSTTYLLRLIKYRGPQKNETCIGTSCHTDKSFITVLHQNEVCGLEIRTKDGEWISFKPSPSSYVVMAGDALLVGYYHLFDKPSKFVKMKELLATKNYQFFYLTLRSNPST